MSQQSFSTEKQSQNISRDPAVAGSGNQLVVDTTTSLKLQDTPDFRIPSPNSLVPTVVIDSKVEIPSTPVHLAAVVLDKHYEDDDDARLYTAHDQALLHPGDQSDSLSMYSDDSDDATSPISTPYGVSPSQSSVSLPLTCDAKSSRDDKSLEFKVAIGSPCLDLGRFSSGPFEKYLTVGLNFDPREMNGVLRGVDGTPGTPDRP